MSFVSFTEEKFEDFLRNFTSYKAEIGMRKVPHTKPGHGQCCTCGTCGYHYDDCVCSHNELINYIEEHKNGTK